MQRGLPGLMSRSYLHLTSGNLASDYALVKALVNSELGSMEQNREQVVFAAETEYAITR